MEDLQDFLSPVSVKELMNDETFTDGQFAKHIRFYETEFPDLTDVDIVMVGIGEMRGTDLNALESNAPNQIRKQFYALHHWHSDILIADIGNVKQGALINDSYAALQTVIGELFNIGKKVIILGGSHDITLAQYYAYKSKKKSIVATCIDATIDLRGDSFFRQENFLLDMLTSEPNYISHYNHIGFQSYFVHPRLLETMDKLRFDCYRVGVVKSDIEQMEPVIRQTNLLSFDIAAIKNSAAPSNVLTTNGLNGEEACILSQYAGMSSNLSSFGIYGYNPENDVHDLTAKQIAQMLWYYLDGLNAIRYEAALEDNGNFNLFHTYFSELETLFMQSKKTNRWWMQMPDKKFIPCSYKDYMSASMNDIPERWLRAQERMA
jgi:arginase family enzyme